MKVKRMFWYSLPLVIGLVLFSAYIRLNKVDVGRWHKPISFDGEERHTAGSYALRVPLQGGDGRAVLEKLHRIAAKTPRTKVLIGDPEGGMITYITRSLVFGFPDFTTVRYSEIDGVLEFYARLQYGGSDLGVNRKRVEAWVEALEL